MKNHSKHKAWWNSLSEQKKWNLTINYLLHWSLISDEQILNIYNENY